MATVFISYSREESARAEELARALDIYDITSFRYTEGIPPGEPWEEYVAAKIDSSRVVVVLWSAASARSQWVDWEWRRAHERDKRVIPVILDTTPLPTELGSHQWIDARRSLDDEEVTWSFYRLREEIVNADGPGEVSPRDAFLVDRSTYVKEYAFTGREPEILSWASIVDYNGEIEHPSTTPQENLAVGLGLQWTPGAIARFAESIHAYRLFSVVVEVDAGRGLDAVVQNPLHAALIPLAEVVVLSVGGFGGYFRDVRTHGVGGDNVHAEVAFVSRAGAKIAVDACRYVGVWALPQRVVEGFHHIGGYFGAEGRYSRFGIAEEVVRQAESGRIGARSAALLPAGRSAAIVQTYAKIASLPILQTSVSAWIGRPLRYYLERRVETVPLATRARLAIEDLHCRASDLRADQVVAQFIEPELQAYAAALDSLQQWSAAGERIIARIGATDSRFNPEFARTMREEALRLNAKVVHDRFYLLYWLLER